MPKPLRVWAQSLGCPKNRVDTERLLGSLGADIKLCDRMADSRLIFINTCAFIEPATRESIRSILKTIERVASYKRKPLIIVAGCLVGRYGIEELSRELPEVDLWLAVEDQNNWPRLVRNKLSIENGNHTGRIISTPPSYAWLKISDGCMHKCSFCAIPSIRGPLRSATSENILAEAKHILARDVKELVLVAQDLTAWGKDPGRGPQQSLEDLISQLAVLPGLKWLRLLYLYPNAITDNLIKFIASFGLPLLPYLDIPLQHSDPEILKSMGRPFAVDARTTLEKIRKYIPNAAIRTSLIVGYPGETDKKFEDLLQFVKDARFQHLGVFTYHAEEGTRAATMPNQVADGIKEERRARLMEVQAEISADNLRRYRGQRLDVLVDKDRHDEWPGLHEGRVWFQAPEIDGITYVSGSGVMPGVMRACDIEDSATYDLTALAC